MSRILVTGSLGAVGTPLTALLVSQGHEVWGCDLRHSDRPNYFRCDVTDYRLLASFFAQHAFEFVYHTAAEFGRNNGEQHYDVLWRTNAIGTKNLIRLQEQYRFRMVVFSSSEVYGDWDGVMSEDVMETQAIWQMNDYAISKWVNELQVIQSSRRFDTETVRVRLFNTYGPGEMYTPYRSAACVFTYNALHDRPYTVFLDHHRTSTYIDDSVRALAAIVHNFKSGAVYNIAGDEYHDIKYLSDTILRRLGKTDRNVIYRPFERENTRNKLSDNKRAKEDLGYQSTVSMEEGIERTIAWQKKIYHLG